MDKLRPTELEPVMFSVSVKPLEHDELGFQYTIVTPECHFIHGRDHTLDGVWESVRRAMVEHTRLVRLKRWDERHQENDE